jgi:hypothetical protein
VRMVHQRGVHVEKDDAPETAAQDAQGLRHNFWFSEPTRMAVRLTVQRLKIARITRAPIPKFAGNRRTP